MAIYYLCPDIDRPVGGIRVIYRHVDILNQNGLLAFVLHRRPPFSCTWFEHDTPVRYLYRRPKPRARPLPVRLIRDSFRYARARMARRASSDMTPLGGGDVLVVPEGDLKRRMALYPGVPKVIFNQNTYNTFRGWSVEAHERHPYRNPHLLAVLTASDDGERYLEMAFPDLVRLRVRYSIDPLLFTYQSQKKKQISYMPRKNRHDAHQVLLMLHLRSSLEGWDVVPIEDMTETEVATVLHDSAVFLSFGGPEGFGIPPAEAMRCGCIVIGYHGMGGREYFRPDVAYPIEFGDIRLYVETVESVLQQLDSAPDALRAKAKAGSDVIVREYSPEREERSVLAAWREILALRGHQDFDPACV